MQEMSTVGKIGELPRILCWLEYSLLHRYTVGRRLCVCLRYVFDD